MSQSRGAASSPFVLQVSVPSEGELRIVASTTPAEFVVPRLVADFTIRHPRVRAVVFSTDSAGVVAELREGRPRLFARQAQQEARLVDDAPRTPLGRHAKDWHSQAR